MWVFGEGLGGWGGAAEGFAGGIGGRDWGLGADWGEIGVDLRFWGRAAGKGIQLAAGGRRLVVYIICLLALFVCAPSCCGGGQGWQLRADS